MNKTYNLSDKTAVSLRKIIGIISIVLSILSVVLIGVGFIPLFQRKSSIITIGYNALEILKFTSKPLFYCLFKCAFSILYVVLVWLSVRDIFALFASMKGWMKEEHDTKKARTSVTNCVLIQNDIFIRFIVLFVVSYALDSFVLTPMSKLILIGYALANIILNVMRMFLVKHNLLEGLLSPVSTGLLLLVAMLFMFNIFDVELGVVIKQFIRFLQVLFVLGSTVSTGYIFTTVATQIILPIFYIVVLIRLVNAFVTSITYGTKFTGFARSCKSIMIGNIVVSVIIMSLQMIGEKNANPEVLFTLLINNLGFILLSVAVFLLSKNQGSDIPDVPDYDELLKEEQERQAQESQFAYSGYDYNATNAGEYAYQEYNTNTYNYNESTNGNNGYNYTDYNGNVNNGYNDYNYNNANNNAYNYNDNNYNSYNQNGYEQNNYNGYNYSENNYNNYSQNGYEQNNYNGYNYNENNTSGYNNGYDSNAYNTNGYNSNSYNSDGNGYDPNAYNSDGNNNGNYQ